MPYSEEQLRQAVDQVFARYDADNSGTLERSEVYKLINDALASMNAGRQVTEAEVDGLVNSVDKNNDKKISKPELYEIFKQVAAK